MISVIVGKFSVWQLALFLKGKMSPQGFAYVLNSQGHFCVCPPLTFALVYIYLQNKRRSLIEN